VVRGWATLKPNTAVCIALLGAALVAPERWRTPLAAVPALVAGVTCIEWATSVDLGIDRLLTLDPASVAAGEPPGRMAFATAIALLMAAVAVALSVQRPGASQAAAAGMLAVAWIALWGYAYELGPLSSVWLFGSVSLPTAVALLFLGAGSLAIRPDAGWVTALSSGSGAARLLRRLGPAAILLPAVTGWLVLHLERSTELQPGFAVALGATLNACVFALLLAATAAATRREERARAEAEDRVRSREASLAELTRELIAAHEEERRALAHELHDELGQTLTALALLLARVGHDPTSAGEAAELVAALTANVRQMSLDLRPSLLDDLGLAPAVQWLASRFPSVPIAVRIRGEPRRYAAEIEIAAFRIVQEALTNAVRHAQATGISLEFGLSDDVDIEITDDGRGFDPERAAVGRTVGLAGMRHRAEGVGGTVFWRSAPGRGTTVRVILPSHGGHPGG
jgi:signal transduction histidine kinase